VFVVSHVATGLSLPEHPLLFASQMHDVPFVQHGPQTDVGPCTTELSEQMANVDEVWSHEKGSHVQLVPEAGHVASAQHSEGEPTVASLHGVEFPLNPIEQLHQAPFT
jgi:hypothetical protein